MATSQAALSEPLHAAVERSRTRRVDFILLAGVAIALSAVVAGLYAAGISISYFLQPTGAVIVLGGTFGVILVTSPRHSLVHSFRRVIDLIVVEEVNREALIEEIISFARAARRSSILAIEPLLPQTTHPFLREALQLSLDVSSRPELEALLETELRMRERQGEADAKTLEVAGGFAPTIGILGTVVGLIEVLKQFSNLPAVGIGIGTAFVSTIYGLGLANLILLPAAHRIRAKVAEDFEIQELIMEGVLSIVDTVHPTLIRARLGSFVRQKNRPSPAARPAKAHSA